MMQRARNREGLRVCRARVADRCQRPRVSGRTNLVQRHETGEHPSRLEEAHRDLHITPDEFDEVAAELGRSLDHFGVPSREKDEVLAAFAAHKGEVTEGSMASA
jgi:hypothetical protein